MGFLDVSPTSFYVFDVNALSQLVSCAAINITCKVRCRRRGRTRGNDDLRSPIMPPASPGDTGITEVRLRLTVFECADRSTKPDKVRFCAQQKVVCHRYLIVPCLRYGVSPNGQDPITPSNSAPRIVLESSRDRLSRKASKSLFWLHHLKD
jgi:hypothetical protein